MLDGEQGKLPREPSKGLWSKPCAPPIWGLSVSWPGSWGAMPQQRVGWGLRGHPAAAAAVLDSFLFPNQPVIKRPDLQSLDWEAPRSSRTGKFSWLRGSPLSSSPGAAR